MNRQLVIVLIVWALLMYLVGIIAWIVQNDALKRGYSSISATFWSISIVFMAPIMLPLYILLREKSVPEEVQTTDVGEAKKKLYIVCPFCGEENPPENSRCLKCEKSIIGEGVSLGSKSCQYCGEDNDVNSSYCKNCNQPM